jgi:PAS domain S-box-containing protein
MSQRPAQRAEAGPGQPPEIRTGDVDSLVIGPPGQEQVIPLSGADRPYRLIVEAMNEGAATLSPRGIILEANPHLSTMTGRTTAELAGLPVLDLITPGGRDEAATLLGIEPDGSARGETELARPDGTTMPVLVAVSAFDLDGMLLRCLIITDLTAQRAEQARTAEAYQVLQEQSALLEQAQAALGLGWWIADLRADGRLAVSPEIHRIFGLSLAEFDGRAEELWGMVHPDDAQTVTESYRATLTEGRPFHAEHRIIRRDGSVRWVQQHAAVRKGPAGKPQTILGICQDITDQEQAAAQARATAARYQALAEDLRIRLHALTSASTALLAAESGDRLSAADREHLSRILSASEWLTTLIHELPPLPLPPAAREPVRGGP